MRQLIWFRTDLRVRDNTALAAAMAAGPTLALYLVSPTQWLAHDDAPCKVDFWLRNLGELSTALRRLGVPLLIRTVDSWQQAPQALAALCREQRIDCVQVNDEYGVHESRRDQAVAAELQTHGIGLRRHLDQLLFNPGSILTQSGGYFQVYSQFRKVCYSRLHLAAPACAAQPEAQAPLAQDSDPIPQAVAGFARPAESLRQLWPAGEQEALSRLQRFTDESMADYREARDRPASAGTSQLSPYLAAGVLSPRQCLQAALMANAGEFESGNPGAVSWINELLWREFYKHILVGYPRVSRHRAFRADTEAVAWRHAPNELAAWQQGRTGFPIIDAAMRQLLATGWMHNRLRMIVAMFLTKNLLIDWREGERFFMRQLIDGDLAANNGGWQWSASTGTDSAPYFRIFNPLSQSEKFDAEGRFIRQWLPELAELGNKDLHKVAALNARAQGLFSHTDYPRPMVDLGQSRARALAAFKRLATPHAIPEPDHVW
ncbi:MAG: deoxyribodipyrimidine photo-lyase [Pseudomonas sp.]|uniref:deoxyribodipyrimidine photo-lyase n=1 Tax=Pseudomonas sp. TaxID=306 RepID=UPI0033977959